MDLTPEQLETIRRVVANYGHFWCMDADYYAARDALAMDDDGEPLEDAETAA